MVRGLGVMLAPVLAPVLVPALALGLGWVLAGCAVPSPATPPVAAATADTCPYHPAFRELQLATVTLPPDQAAAAWERYAAAQHDPQTCEGHEIDRRLAALETQLFTLQVDGRQMPSQVVLRCNQFDDRTARCDGPRADGTARRDGMDSTRLPPGAAPPFVAGTARSGAKLKAVYLLSLRDAREGRRARRMAGRLGKVTLPADTRDAALVAIYTTEGPWRYRKAVWYF